MQVGGGLQCVAQRGGWPRQLQNFPRQNGRKDRTHRITQVNGGRGGLADIDEGAASRGFKFGGLDLISVGAAGDTEVEVVGSEVRRMKGPAGLAAR